MQDDVLAGNVLVQLALELEFQRRGYLEPRLADRHAARHIGRTDTRRKSAECAVGAGVGIRADHGIAGNDESFFGEQRVLDAHLTYVVEVGDVLRTAEITAHHALLRRLDVLVRSKVIHDHGHFFLIEYVLLAHLVERLDGDRRGNVIAKHEIQIHQHELPCLDLVKTGMCGEDLLCHGHSHVVQSFQM